MHSYLSVKINFSVDLFSDTSRAVDEKAKKFTKLSLNSFPSFEQLTRPSQASGCLRIYFPCLLALCTWLNISDKRYEYKCCHSTSKPETIYF